MEAILLIGALVAIIGYTLDGHRADRRGWKDPISRLGRPDGSFAVFALGSLAIAQLLVQSSVDSHVSALTGIVVGVVLAFTVDLGPVHLLLDAAGILAAGIVAMRFLSGAGGSAGTWTMVFRVELVSLLTFSYVAGAIAGVLSGRRSGKTFAFGKGRGLAFFGLIDTFTFLASPGDVDALGLTPGRFYGYLAVAFLSAVGLGLLAGQFTLFVASAGVVLVNLILPLSGISFDPSAVPTTVYFIAATIVYAISRSARSRLFVTSR
jgi:hypothetical protein